MHQQIRCLQLAMKLKQAYKMQARWVVMYRTDVFESGQPTDVLATCQMLWIQSHLNSHLPQQAIVDRDGYAKDSKGTCLDVLGLELTDRLETVLVRCCMRQRFDKPTVRAPRHGQECSHRHRHSSAVANDGGKPAKKHGGWSNTDGGATPPSSVLLQHARSRRASPAAKDNCKRQLEP